jgi:hypothetical protein
MYCTDIVITIVPVRLFGASGLMAFRTELRQGEVLDEYSFVGLSISFIAA